MKKRRKNAYQTALDLLSRRDHFRLELAEKLRQREFAADEIEEALARCQSLDLLNDERVFFPLLLADGNTRIIRKASIEDLTQISGAIKPPMGFGKGIMTREEALSILALTSWNFTRQDVIDAHKQMITRVHPDTGGSDYVASRVNAARDVLFDVLFQRQQVVAEDEDLADAN